MLIDILSTILRSLISILVLFVLTRIMGKKQLSQLTFFDYVVGISIGSISAALAVDSSISYLRGITGLIIFALFPIVFSFITIKSYGARKLLDGIPTILIDNGKIVEKNLRKTQLSINDVLEECRQKNAFDIADVEFAILETSGKVSVLLKAAKQPLTPQDMDIKAPYKGLCVNVIIDGRIFDDHLLSIGKDKTWLMTELAKQNIFNGNDVLLGYVDSNQQLIVHRKNAFAPGNPLM